MTGFTHRLPCRSGQKLLNFTLVVDFHFLLLSDFRNFEGWETTLCHFALRRLEQETFTWI